MHTYIYMYVTYMHMWIVGVAIKTAHSLISDRRVPLGSPGLWGSQGEVLGVSGAA